MKITYLSAAWCGPCKRFFPVLKEFCSKNNIELVKEDVDTNTDLAIKYSVKSIPFLILTNGSKELTASGMKTPKELTNLVSSLE